MAQSRARIGNYYAFVWMWPLCESIWFFALPVTAGLFHVDDTTHRYDPMCYCRRLHCNMFMNLPHYKTVQGNEHNMCKLYVSFIAYFQLVQRSHFMTLTLNSWGQFSCPHMSSVWTWRLLQLNKKVLKEEYLTESVNNLLPLFWWYFIIFLENFRKYVIIDNRRDPWLADNLLVF